MLEYQHFMKTQNTRKSGALPFAASLEDSHKATARLKGKTHFSLSTLMIYLKSGVKTLLTCVSCVKSNNTKKTFTEHE